MMIHTTTNKLLATALLLCSTFCCFGQIKAVDSLRRELALVKHDTSKVNIILKISQEYVNAQDNDSVKFYCEQGALLAENINYPKGIANAKLILAHVHKLAGEYEIMFSLMDEAITIFQSVGHQAGIVNVLNNKAKALRLIGQFDEALKTLREALAINRDLPSEEYASLYITMGNVHRTIRNYDSALFYGLKAVEWFDKNKKKNVLLARSFNLLAMVHRSQLNYPKALEFYDKTLAIRKELGLPNDANLLNQLGTLYRERKELAKSLEFQLMALEQAEKGNNKSAIGAALFGIGACYDAMGESNENFEKSLEYYSRSLNAFEEIGQKEHIVAVSGTIGNVYRRWGKPEIARDYFLRGIKYCRKEGLTHRLNSAYGNYSTFLQEAKAYDSAMWYAAQRLKLTRDNNWPRMEMQALRNVLRVRVRGGEDGHGFNTVTQTELAELGGIDSLLKRLIELTNKTQNEGQHQATNASLHNYYEFTGDLGKAYPYLKLFLEGKIENLSEQNSKNMAEMAEKFESEKKEQENELLRKENDIQAATISQQRLTNYLVISFALFTGIIGVILYRNHQKQKSTNKIITEQKDHLEKLNDTKVKLLSLLSHDLRNPLFSLETGLRMVMRKSVSPDEFKEMAIDLDTKLQNTSNFLENVLQWAKTQLSEIEPNMETYPVQKMVDETVSLLEPMATNKGIKLEVNIAQDLEVNADYEMIKGVIRNLTANAIKYSGNEDVVAIHAESKANKVHIKVSDNGIGMDDDTVKDLFSLATPTHKGTKGETGTGLGLILSKEFVEKHGGQITVESELGKGSAFVVTI